MDGMQMDGRTVWDGVRQKLMGIKATRGKWKSAVPNHKNVFVFRWGPIFEDCAGKALASTAAVHLAQPPGSISMRPATPRHATRMPPRPPPSSRPL